ncbi:glycosyltransferase family 4 protein [Candidatus Poribacteria bacterium]|nr:glycosyltransferase family 4 protein [Candidatus Poribacteria bacterium]
MRIAFIASPGNPHVQRWGAWVLAQGHQLALVSRDAPPEGALSRAEWIEPRWTVALNALAFGLCRTRRSGELFAPLAIGPVLSRWQPDIVHGFDALHNGWAAVRSVRKARHVVQPFGSDIFAGWRQGRLERFLVTRALLGADAVTCNLPGIGDTIHRQFGFRPRCSMGFSWGIDTEVFGPERAANEHPWREELGVPAGARLLFSPRGLRAYQGRDILGAVQVIETFGRVAGEFPDLHLAVLTGWSDPGIRTAWDRARGALGAAAARVHAIERRLSAHEMAALYRASDLFISVPRSDLLSMCVLEGLGCGAYGIAGGCPDFEPVLIREQGMILEVVDPLDTAGIAEAIRRGIHALAEGRNFAAGNAEKIRLHHDWRKQAPKLGELYALQTQKTP